MAVYLDMVGGKNQRFYAESTSDRSLTTAIWGVAAELGLWRCVYQRADLDFGRCRRDVSMTEMCLRRRLPTSTIPIEDTLNDTLDQLSADSLERVGATLKTWLERGAPF